MIHYSRKACTALMLMVMPGGLTCCNPEKSAGKLEAARPDRQPIRPVAVEVRADGLAYLPGSAAPFSGDAIVPHEDMPWLVKLKEPYRDGKRDGDKLELYKNGKPKHLRRYESGVPKYTAGYHKNGQIKFELNLNASDKGEGPYKRWYEDGTLESTASFDAEERWHGVLKEWTKTGELKSHHIFSHGLLQEIIFETPESRAAREKAGVELQKPPASPEPAPAGQ